MRLELDEIKGYDLIDVASPEDRDMPTDMHDPDFIDEMVAYNTIYNEQLSLKPAVAQWCRDTGIKPPKPTVDDDGPGFVLVFKSDADATAFKIRWL